jgi:hypothetical protein
VTRPLCPCHGIEQRRNGRRAGVQRWRCSVLAAARDTVYEKTPARRAAKRVYSRSRSAAVIEASRHADEIDRLLRRVS